jgi:uncharacterized phiE125 gp8 family phage protein
MHIYSERIVTQPTTEPVDLATAKAHLRVSDTAEDVYISSLITVSRVQIEQWTDRALLTQTWDLWLPASTIARQLFHRERDIRVPRGPVASIDLVETIDDSGTATTVDSSLYVKDLLSEPCEVRFPGGLPEGRLHIRYTAGATSPDDVPATLKQAILLLIGAMYENRAEEYVAASTLLTVRLQLGVESLIRNEKWGDRC